MAMKIQLFPDGRYLNSPLPEHQPITLAPVTDSFGADRSQVYWCSLKDFVTGGPTVDLSLFSHMLLVATYETDSTLVGRKEGSTFVADFPYNVGQVDLYSYYGWYWDDDWYQDSLDLENSALARFAWEEGDAVPYPSENQELWVWWSNGDWRLNMRTSPYVKYQGPVAYELITRDLALAQTLAVNADYGPIAVGDVFILRTSRGRYAKLQVVEHVPYDPSGAYNRAIRVRVKFLVFNEPGLSD
jgi:hypothetical protein